MEKEKIRRTAGAIRAELRGQKEVLCTRQRGRGCEAAGRRRAGLCSMYVRGRNSNMKVLLLSCNTGEGHNSAARAIREQFEAREIPCTIENALGFASEKISEYICNTYVKITLHTPKLFGWGYRVGRDIASPKRKSPVYFANKLYADALGAYIAEHGFDTVIMPHVFPAEAMTALRRAGKCDARLYAVSTDYSCCPFFEEIEVDRYFIPHASLIPQFVERGIPREKLKVSGIPVSTRFLEKVDKAEARRRLGLPAEGSAALIMTGSMGFGNTKAITEELLRCAPQMQVVILGGNNESAKAELRKTFGGYGNVRVEDFTREVPLYMDACDVLFTKPGGLTSTEAAVKQIPILHTAPIPGCETENLQFFSELGLSLAEADVQAAAQAAAALCADPQACREMAERQAREINARAAEYIAEQVLAEAGEQA